PLGMADSLRCATSSTSPFQALAAPHGTNDWRIPFAGTLDYSDWSNLSGQLARTRREGKTKMANPRTPFRMSSARPHLEPFEGKPLMVHIVVNVEHWPFDQK